MLSSSYMSIWISNCHNEVTTLPHQNWRSKTNIKIKELKKEHFWLCTHACLRSFCLHEWFNTTHQIWYQSLHFKKLIFYIKLLGECYASRVFWLNQGVWAARKREIMRNKRKERRKKQQRKWRRLEIRRKGRFRRI